MCKILDKIIDHFTLEINWNEVEKIDEFKKCQLTEHNCKWHLEGNILNHIKATVNAIYSLCPIEKEDFICSSGEGSKRYFKRYILTLAALFHDIGKPLCLKINDDGSNSFPHHAKVSEQITRKLLWDEYFIHRELICSLVGNHMKPLYVFEKEDPLKYIITLAEEPVSLEWLLLLKTADCMGSQMKEYDGWREKLEDVRKIAIENDCLTKPYTFSNTTSRYAYFNNENVSHPSVFFKDKSEFEVYVFIGIPGSGKTTYRSKLPTLPIVCRDDIRTEIGIKGKKPMGTKKQEDEVTRIQNERILNYACKKESFIIDATNLKWRYRNKFKTILAPYNPKIIYVYIEAPTFQDNLNRRKGQIPKDIIIKMRDNFEFPKMTECEELIIEKQGLERFKSFRLKK